jgi:hypothetical protein
MLAILLALALVLIPVGSAFAATTADVTVNATPGFVSITNAPTTFDFGVVYADTDENTGNAYFTVTNDSTVDMDVSIHCDGWTVVPPGTNSWTYGAPADDTARLYASSANGGAGGSGGQGTYDILLPSSAPGTLLMDAVGTATDPTWELQIDAPTGFTHVDEQETTVTLTASVD